jgi:hypothetical protein
VGFSPLHIALLLLSVGHGLLLTMAKGSGHRTGLGPLAAGALLALLALAVAGSDRVLPLLETGKGWLFSRGDLMVALVSLARAGYLGWQGIESLQLGLELPLEV